MKGTRTMPVSKRRRPAPEPDTTLLEYVAERLMGPPHQRVQLGESYWPCPACASPKWHTMPHREGYKDRFLCWACNYRGDEDDLLKWFCPKEAYGQRLQRLDRLRDEYGGLTTPNPGKEDPRRAAGPLAGLPSRGSGLEADPLTAGLGGSTDPFDVEEAYRNASPRQVESLVQAFVLARTAGVDLVALCRFAWRWEMEWVRWLRDLDKEVLERLKASAAGTGGLTCPWHDGQLKRPR
jgi:hypothetical protein